MAVAAPFLATKLRPPLAPLNPIRRQRLVARLHENRPFTLIAAPAGFGKTTLLAEWLGQNPGPVAWLTLDAEDNDPTRFWGYFMAALRQVEPAVGETVLALLQSPPPPWATVLTVVINEIATQARPLAFVLEDYHVIGAQPIHEALTFLLDHLPADMRVILTTRADPPLPLAGRRARGQLTEIRMADLRFTSDEAAAFLNQALGPSLSSENIAALEARTEGWIAGLQLAALSLQGRRDASTFVETFTGSHRYVIDYLVTEVLARQAEPIQTFLLQTAILERLNASLCEAVLMAPSSPGSGQATLEHLERANLFLTSLDDERQWYRYHSLFAETLRHRLRRQQAALVPALHRRASAWYEQHGLKRDAIYHALAAGDFERAAGLMEQSADLLVRQGEVVTLQHWVDALPSDIVRSHVEVSIWQGWLLFVGGKYEAAERLLEDLESRYAINREVAEQSVQQPAVGRAFNPAEIYGRVAAIRASIAIIHRDLPRTIALSRQALDFLPPKNLARAYAAWYLGKAHWLAGDLEAASLALASAERISWDVNHLYGVFLVTCDLAQVQMAQGHLRQADQTYRRALQRAARPSEPHPAFGPTYVGRGQLEREWNHLEAAVSLFQQGMLLCEQAGNTPAVLQATLGLAFVRQAQGIAGDAGELMQRAQGLAGRPNIPPSTSAHAAACQARLALMQSDEVAAASWARGSGLDVDQPLNHVRESEYLTLVRVLIWQGKLAEAQAWLAILWRLAEAQRRASSEVEILILQAEACRAAGDLPRANGRLARAISMARPEGFVRLFLDEGEPMARLLAGLDGQPEDATYRESLLALLGGAPIDVPAGQTGLAPDARRATLIDPLSERELAVLRLIVAGHSNQEIADRLVIAVSTVKWYANVIYGKLGVESRTKAIARARELKLV